MNIFKKGICLSLLSLSAPVFANTVVSSCPAIDEIHRPFDFVFEASNAAGNWSQTVQAPNRGGIKSFDEALMVVDNGKLRLVHCTYNLEEKGVVDLSLQDASTRDREVEIKNYQDKWTKEDSGFVTYFVCTGDAEECQFEFEQ
ncbi:DUF3757 domain-containing protein [Veronia pacifica]|uniref:DUF3757 domain-containing protein n=1 Tax=Veronia pacifica TaxID=1080227 RepID=A0A1C3EKP2_9GAMM|nr:DUF3757 domain-containing protein [Veronia pacifica]ODA33795.1 hypothetical protein A8L45_09200 [Veronia pacifica]